MSVDVYVVAQRRISVDDFKCVELYNELCDRGFDVPSELAAHLEGIGAISIYLGERTAIVGEMIEVSVKGEGNAKYGNGLVIDVGSLPPDTIALRIYMG